MFTPILLAMTLATAEPAADLRVRTGDIDFGRAESRELFRQRLAVNVGAFCDRHRARLTPQHIRARGWCEREMSAAVVRALPASARLDIRRDAETARRRPVAVALR